MTDKKISQLTAAATPLTGTEVLPIVQNGSTVKTPINTLLDGFANTGTGNNVRSVNPKIEGQISAGNIQVKNGTGFTTSNGVIQKWSAYAGSENQFEIAAIEWVTSDFVDGGGIVFKSTTSATPTEGFRLTPSGNIAMASGKGIDFSATAGTGTSELLADYEEGTWTPTWNGGTFTSTAATYTKIGRIVYLQAALVFGASSLATPAIIGLPFSMNSTSNSSGSINYTDYGPSAIVNLDAGANALLFRFAINTSNLANTDVSGKTFAFNATYIT